LDSISQERQGEEKEMSLSVSELKGKLTAAQNARKKVLTEAEHEREKLLAELHTQKQKVLQTVEFETGAMLDNLRSQNHIVKNQLEHAQEKVEHLQNEVYHSKLRKETMAREFEQLRTALRVAEKADAERVNELTEMIKVQKQAIMHRQRETEAATLVRINEIRARVTKAETRKWQALLQEEQRKSDDAIAKAKIEADQKYERLVQTLSDRYTTEYTAILKSMETKKRKQIGQIEEYQRQLYLAKKQESDARMQFERLETYEKRRKQTDDEKKQQAEANLESNKRKVYALWDALDVNPAERVQFLRLVEENSPFCKEVAERYAHEIQKMQHAVPLLEHIHKREALQWRVYNVLRYMRHPLQTEVDGTKTELESLGFVLPISQDDVAYNWKASTQRARQVMQLKQQFAVTVKQLADQNSAIMRKCDRFFEEVGEPFTHRNRNYREEVEKAKDFGEEELDLDVALFNKEVPYVPGEPFFYSDMEIATGEIKRNVNRESKEFMDSIGVLGMGDVNSIGRPANLQDGMTVFDRSSAPIY
jgi:hypothetical protein